MRWAEIVEARSNPSMNRKVPFSAQLERYAGQDVFVTFTTNFGTKTQPQAKIGINPTTVYDTPVGIYTYPIDYLIRYREKTGNIAPYTGSSKWQYAFVVRPTSPETLLDRDSVLVPYWEKLSQFSDDIGHPFTYDTEKNLQALWTETMKLAELIKPERPAIAWNSVFRALGISGIADYWGNGIIHPNEPTQAVFFDKSAIRVIDMISADGSTEDRTEELKRVLRNNIPVSLNNFSLSTIVSAIETIGDIHHVRTLLRAIPDQNIEEINWQMHINRADIPKNQLSQYAEIILQQGWSVDGMDHYMMVAFSDAISDIASSNGSSDDVYELMNKLHSAMAPNIKHNIGSFADRFSYAAEQSDLDDIKYLALCADPSYAVNIDYALGTSVYRSHPVAIWGARQTNVSMGELRQIAGGFAVHNRELAQQLFAGVSLDGLEANTEEDVAVLKQIFGSVPSGLTAPRPI